MDFYCGFCAAEKFKTLETKITNIENKLNQTPSDRIQEQPFIWGTSNPVQFPQLITQIQSAEREKERRSKNLIVPENIDSKMNDEELVCEILKINIVTPATKPSTTRITRKNKSQVIKITFEEIKNNQEVLKNSMKLQENLPGVYKNPDLTQLEQHAQFLLRQELKSKRVEFPGKKWKIAKNLVVEMEQ